MSRETQRNPARVHPRHTPMWIQVLFFGACSAILSTATGRDHQPRPRCARKNSSVRLDPNMGDCPVPAHASHSFRCRSLGRPGTARTLEEPMYDMDTERVTRELVAALVAARRPDLLEESETIRARSCPRVRGSSAWPIPGLPPAAGTQPCRRTLSRASRLHSWAWSRRYRPRAAAAGAPHGAPA